MPPFQDLRGRSTYFKQERKNFGNCWSSLLAMELPEDCLDHVLSNLPTEVIPRMTQPLRLSDFLLTAYNRGGAIAVLCLDSLWLLIMEHGLDYPHFYEKLYALLTNDTFLTRERSRCGNSMPELRLVGELRASSPDDSRVRAAPTAGSCRWSQNFSHPPTSLRTWWPPSRSGCSEGRWRRHLRAHFGACA